MQDFTFNASALGAGGIVERGNVVTTIPSIGSVALAPTGGEGRSLVTGYFSEEIAFSHAETRVFGRQTGNKRFTTSTYVLIKDLNIFNRLTIEQMRATVTSERGLEPDDDHEFELELSYRGVLVDGVEITPATDATVKSIKRYSHLEKVLTSDARKLKAEGLVPSKNKKELLERFNAPNLESLQRELEQRKPVQGSMVDTIEGRLQEKHLHRIVIPDLGRVYFAELMLKPGRRRLNLLRIKFGARGFRDDDVIEEAITNTLGGSMTVASVEGNGTPIGP